MEDSDEENGGLQLSPDMFMDSDPVISANQSELYSTPELDNQAASCAR